MRDIAGLVGLAEVFAAQNRASGKMDARICADANEKKGGVIGQQCLLPY